MAEAKTADNKQVCRCPQCGAAYRVSIGKTAKCPKCAVTLEAPATPAPAPARPAGGKSSSALRGGSPTAGKRSSARLGGADSAAGRRTSRIDGGRGAGRGASSGRMRSESGERPERGGRSTREKKSLPVIPIAVGGVIVVIALGALFMFNDKTPPAATNSSGAATGETFPSYSATSQNPQGGTPDPWAIGSANYKDPEKEKDLDWSKDDTHETDMQKRRSKGFRGELPPDAYGKDPKDTGGRPLAGDGSTPPAQDPAVPPETPAPSDPPR